MIKVTTSRGKAGKSKCDVLALLFVEGVKDLSDAGKAADKATGGALKRLLKEGFEGKKAESLVIPTGSGSSFSWIALIGLGPRDKLDGETYRKAGGRLIRALNGKKTPRCHLEFPEQKITGLSDADLVRALSEGAMLGSYKYTEFKKNNSNKGVKTLAVYSSAAGLKQAVDIAGVVCKEQALAMDLCNRPGRELYPESFAKIAAADAKKLGFTCKVMSEKELERRGMGGLLGVGQGSDRPPRLVVLHYSGGGKSKKPIVLVGKGITFDSGGISIKPSAKMGEMKTDMSGAAVVLGALRAAAQLKLKTDVYAVMALAENMPGGGAIRPGDVLRSASGLTIEVANTDAEGRVVLADALDYAKRLKPKYIVDVATLTGAAAIALGSPAIAMMGTDEDLIAKVSAAGLAAGERTWLLPLWEDYDELVKSDIADVLNVGNRREAGTIVGGVFLKKFVGDVPWVHLDIAAGSWNSISHPYYGKGGTGKGMRLLVKLLENM